MVVPPGEPLSVTSVPAPALVGLMVPERLNVCVDVAVKLTFVAFAPLIDTVRNVGVNVNPALLGVTV